MSRWDNWLRIRHDPETPPSDHQVSLARKVLGELMEGIQRGGLFQNKLTRRFDDGTVVIAQFDGITPMVEVIEPGAPEPAGKPGCRCLKGKIDPAFLVRAPGDVGFREDAFGGTLRVIPAVVDDVLYVLYFPDLTDPNATCWRFDRTKREFVQEAGSYELPTSQAGTVLADYVNTYAYGYMRGNRRRLVLQRIRNDGEPAGGPAPGDSYPFQRLHFVEYEIGVGKVEAYATEPGELADRALPILLRMPPIVLGRVPHKYEALAWVPAVTDGNEDFGGLPHAGDYASTYDYIQRKWGPRLDTPYQWSLYGGVLEGRAKLFGTVLENTPDGNVVLPYDVVVADYRARKLTYRTSPATTDPATHASLTPRLWAQRCCCMTFVSRPTTSQVGRNYEVSELNLATEKSQVVGYLDADPYYYAGFMAMFADAAYVFFGWRASVQDAGGGPTTNPFLKVYRIT